MSLYEPIDVWQRCSATKLKRYRCFRNVVSGRYSVQSADFYKLPVDTESAVQLERQWLELLAEQPPDERAGSFDSLRAAIDAHDREFSE